MKKVNFKFRKYFFFILIGFLVLPSLKTSAINIEYLSSNRVKQLFALASKLEKAGKYQPALDTFKLAMQEEGEGTKLHYFAKLHVIYCKLSLEKYDTKDLPFLRSRPMYEDSKLLAFRYYLLAIWHDYSYEFEETLDNLARAVKLDKRIRTWVLKYSPAFFQNIEDSEHVDAFANIIK